MPAAEVYESPWSTSPDPEYLIEVRRVLPASWSIVRNQVWFECNPPGPSTTPPHGWKIHVSARQGNANEILKRVVRVLVEGEISFKFAADRAMLAKLNSSETERSGAGKFITIYPHSVESARELLEALYVELRGFAGPYILSDRRYKDCRVLYYRYGGMTPSSKVWWNGERKSWLVGPDGTNVEDQRRPWFELPPWIARDPFAGEDAVEETSDGVVLGERYRIERPLQFNPAGGVYLGRDLLTDREVVVKEARPFLGEEPDGRDSTDSLRREFEILQYLEHLGIAPKPLDFFESWEHAFLVEEYVAGLTFGHFAAAQGPLVWGNGADTMRETRRLWLALVHCVERIHDAGVACGDLSLENVIVSPDERHVRILDFESAVIESDRESAMIAVRTPGFSSPARRRGEIPTFADDLYSIGAIIAAMVSRHDRVYERFPLMKRKLLPAMCADAGLGAPLVETILSLLDDQPERRPTLKQLADAIEQDQDAPGRRDAPVLSVRLESSGVSAFAGSEMTWLDTLIRSTERGITESAVPARSDRLFPADPRLFETNPLSVAYGAAGAARALAISGMEVSPKVLSWILSRNITADRYPPGLYLGLSGLSWSFVDLRMPDIAVRVAREAWNHPLLTECMDVFHGTAGYGLSQLRLWRETEEEAFLDEAIRAADTVLAAAERVEGKGICWPDAEGNARIGYAHGASGIALFLLYLHLATGERRFLEKGLAALRFDLSYAATMPRGFVGFPSETKTRGGKVILSPYWKNGAAGVGRVLLRYMIVTGDESFAEHIPGIVKSCISRHCVLAGLFLGLAGLVDFLVDCSLMTGSADCLDAALWGASGLELFCVPLESGGVGYVGETMEHLSSDYGTGGAGVLCALARLSKAVKGEEAGGFEFVLDELLPRKLVDMPELNRRMSAEIAEMRHLWPAWEACFASGWRKSRC